MKISKSEFEIQRHAHMHQAVPSAGKWEFCHLSVVTQAKNEVVTTFQRAKPLPFSVKQAKKHQQISLQLSTLSHLRFVINSDRFHSRTQQLCFPGFYVVLK